LKNEDGGIFQISHDIHDVFDPCDRVIVLNKKHNVGAFWIEDVKTDDILSLIIKGTMRDNGTPRGEKT
jgi:D-xylose transport system ATP-binding protein